MANLLTTAEAAARRAQAARENGKKGGRPRTVKGGERLTIYSLGVPPDLARRLKLAGPKHVREILDAALPE